jgi:hypothetical protein
MRHYIFRLRISFPQLFPYPLKCPTYFLFSPLVPAISFVQPFCDLVQAFLLPHDVAELFQRELDQPAVDRLVRSAVEIC